tara:strand:- start:10070 stop:10297 length:228 start_codon:yes stop_codon:yes gene_type:complete
MENVFMNSIIISIIYILLKYLEMKLIIKEMKPMKLIIRDTLLVFISCVSGFFIFSQMNNGISKIQPSAFVGEADF